MEKKPRPFAVLIVDDEAGDLNLLASLVKRVSPPKGRAGYRILTTSNPAEPLQIVRDQRVDCVLLDYLMPQRDGLQVLKDLLAADKYVAVVMVTGHGNERVAVESMKNGAMDYLVKGPALTVEELERALINAFEKSQMRRTIARQWQDLLEAERHRIMIESLATACHHLGQPATVITAYLELMRKQQDKPDHVALIDECLGSAQAIADIIHRLQQVSQYRVTPYMSPEFAKQEFQAGVIDL